MSKLRVFEVEYYEPNGCEHDIVRMDVDAPATEPHDAMCLLCGLPVRMLDRLDFDAFYVRVKGRPHEYERAWEPDCPTCSGAMTVWQGGKGYALICAAKDDDDSACTDIQWSDTVIGLHTLHQLAMVAG